MRPLSQTLTRSQQAFTHTLYTLAANPDSVTELRAEAEGVLAEHGRSKAAMSKLYKLDAYVKEVMRLQGGGGKRKSHESSPVM